MGNDRIGAKKLIKQSWIGQSERYETAKAAQQKLAEDFAAVPAAVEKPLVDKITEVHRNEKLIKGQVEKLDSEVNMLKKQNKKWEAITTSTRNKLKEYGDIQNWAELIDRDLRVVEETIRIVQTTEY